MKDRPIQLHADLWGSQCRHSKIQMLLPKQLVDNLDVNESFHFCIEDRCHGEAVFASPLYRLLLSIDPEAWHRRPQPHLEHQRPKTNFRYIRPFVHIPKCVYESLYLAVHSSGCHILRRSSFGIDRSLHWHSKRDRRQKLKAGLQRYVCFCSSFFQLFNVSLLKIDSSSFSFL